MRHHVYTPWLTPKSIEEFYARITSIREAKIAKIANVRTSEELASKNKRLRKLLKENARR